MLRKKLSHMVHFSGCWTLVRRCGVILWLFLEILSLLSIGWHWATLVFWKEKRM